MNVGILENPINPLISIVINKLYLDQFWYWSVKAPFYWLFFEWLLSTLNWEKIGAGQCFFNRSNDRSIEIQGQPKFLSRWNKKDRNFSLNRSICITFGSVVKVELWISIRWSFFSLVVLSVEKAPGPQRGIIRLFIAWELD